MPLAAFLMLVITALKWLILIDVLLSWVIPDATRFPRSLTTQITDPLYAPIRAILRPERTGGLDLSPLLMILVLQGMQHLLARAT